MLIASVSHLRYAPFLGALGPVALVGLVIDAIVLVVLFRHDLRPGPFEFEEGHTPRLIHRALLVKSLIVSAAVTVAFLMGVEPALVAASAAAALLITRRVKPEKVYRQIDWDLLVLFIGLFVVVAGVEQAGLARRLFALLEPLGLHTVTGLSVVAVTLSNVISNVPAVMVIARQGARRHQVEITFWQYVRVGVPVTTLTLAFGIWWLNAMR